MQREDPGHVEGRKMSGVFVLIGLVAAFALVVAAVLLIGSRMPDAAREKPHAQPTLMQDEARLSQLPALVQALSRGRAEPRWVALMFSTPDRPSYDDAINLNLSVEDGRVGFDWLLLAPRNIEDQERFRLFARSRGVEPSPRTMNGVSYLRVESVDVAQFTTAVVTEMYQRPSEQSLDLVHDGIEWPPEGG